MMMVRQGDVLLMEIDARKLIFYGRVPIQPEGGRIILQRGEATGHAHSLPAQSVRAWDVRGRMILRVRQPTELTHEEHAAIHIPPGWYQLVRQREYIDQADWGVRVTYVSD